MADEWDRFPDAPPQGDPFEGLLREFSDDLSLRGKAPLDRQGAPASSEAGRTPPELVQQQATPGASEGHYTIEDGKMVVHIGGHKIGAWIDRRRGVQVR